MEGSPSPMAEALALGLSAPGWPPGESSTTAWPCCGRRSSGGSRPPAGEPPPGPAGGELPGDLAALVGTYAAWQGREP
jgi:hypothetical protein